MTGRRGAAVALVAVLIACEGAYLTAPPGSTLTLVANPIFIASHGGVSELMAIVTESVGTDVPDGTVVFWSTTLGHVDRETRTDRGIARNRLVSDSRSGTATVTAVSGGGTRARARSPTRRRRRTPSTSPSTPPTTRPPSPPPGGGRTSNTVQVTIGNVLVTNVLLRAVPSRITISQSTHVIATVLDLDGNPVPNVPVFFEVIPTPTSSSSTAAGRPISPTTTARPRTSCARGARLQASPDPVRAVAAGAGGVQPVRPPEIPVVL